MIDDKWCGTYLLLPDKTYKPCPMLEWVKQLESMMKEQGDKHIADEIVNGKRISTVWLGLDHNFCGTSQPLLFETMVFNEGSSSELYMDRYSTWQEAEAGHAKAIQWVNDGCKDNNEEV